MKKSIQKPEKQFCVVCQKWEESERGWGTRPDGYSLHLSFDDLKKYVSRYWKKMPDEVPDEYSRTCGTPYECCVSEEKYEEVKVKKYGIRSYGDDYPIGDTDGWMNLGKGLHGKL